MTVFAKRAVFEKMETYPVLLFKNLLLTSHPCTTASSCQSAVPIVWPQRGGLLPVPTTNQRHGNGTS